MAWEHAADYEEGTYGKAMYDLEQLALKYGNAGVSLLAEIDQQTAKYRQTQQEALRDAFDS